MPMDKELLLQQILDAVKINNNEISGLKKQIKGLETQVKELREEASKRFDNVDERLKELRQSQEILVQESHQNKVDINLLKNIKRTS